MKASVSPFPFVLILFRGMVFLRIAFFLYSTTEHTVQLVLRVVVKPESAVLFNVLCLQYLYNLRMRAANASVYIQPDRSHHKLDTMHCIM